MTQVFNKSLECSTSVDRIIGKVSGKRKGPTIVFFGGVHGNEPAGVFALKDAFEKLSEKENKVRGTIYGIAGNLKALKTQQRFIDKDLNRIWTKSNLERLLNNLNPNSEEKEQTELFKIIKDILKENKGPFYFIDFHTTSSKTLPFITINDALINRKFSKLFPVPIVLGIEEFLDGPLLSYINQLGFVSLGFEAGQHNEKNAIMNCEAFIFLTLVYAGAIKRDHVLGFSVYYDLLKFESEKKQDIFEVIYRYKIGKEEDFKMLNGFKSFQKINKGVQLAESNNNPIKAKYKGKIFMPLYQNKGEEGFFIIRKIRPFFLNLSTILRRINFDELLVLLPGIRWKNTDKEVMLVNFKVAKFLAKPIFHLLGYRSKHIDDTHIWLYNREKVAKTKIYRKEKWYRLIK